MVNRFQVLADRHELETKIKYLGNEAEALSAAQMGVVLGPEDAQVGLFAEAAAVAGANAARSFKR